MDVSGPDLPDRPQGTVSCGRGGHRCPEGRRQPEPSCSPLQSCCSGRAESSGCTWSKKHKHSRRYISSTFYRYFYLLSLTPELSLTLHLVSVVTHSLTLMLAVELNKKKQTKKNLNLRVTMEKYKLHKCVTTTHAICTVFVPVTGSISQCTHTNTQRHTHKAPRCHLPAVIFSRHPDQSINCLSGIQTTDSLPHTPVRSHHQRPHTGD